MIAPTSPDAPNLVHAQALDAADPLRAFRDRFELPDGVVYLDGNSLGPPPRAAAARMAEAVESHWGQGLVRSWNTAGWIETPRRIGAKIARLIGAGEREVRAADSTSVNLYKLASAALDARPGRRVILAEAGNFPTDLYIAQGLAATRPGVELRIVPRGELLAALDAETAVLLLTHVHYKTGEAFDMAAVTAAAHAHGALTLWDLSHSTGAVAVDLAGAKADLAVGCGYKYLNGGPGAPAYLYVAERHQAQLRSPLWGWMGHARGFDFDDAFQAAEGADRFLCGTPPILAMIALEAGVDLVLEADPAAVHAKSQALCDLFIAATDALCPPGALELVTARGRENRGAHVSFRHQGAYPLMQALIARGVIGDFRAPDVARFGFPALYLRYEDAWRGAETLAEVLASEAWRAPEHQVRAAVT